MNIKQSTYNIMNELESPDNMVNLIIKICERYKLDPSIERNIINIRAFLAPLDGASLLKKNKTLEATNNAIIEIYGANLKSNRRSIADDNEKVRQKLLAIIKKPGDDGKNLSKAYKNTFKNKEGLSNGETLNILDMNMPDRIETIKYLNYSSLIREEYIVVDSRYQNIVNTDRSKIMFNLLTNTKTKSDNGGIIVGNTIKDIVQIEVFPFTIPYKSIFVNFYNKITLSINEWLSNSYEAYEGGQFHFVFDIVKVDNNLIYLNPVDTTYSFSNPMNYIDSFTLSFGAMLPKITFDADRMYSYNLDFTDEFGIITFDKEHNLITGDLVYISGFTTPDPARDVVVIDEMNRHEGHTIVKKDNFSVLLNVNLSLVRHEVPIGSNIYPIDAFSHEILVYFACKRIQIPFRLKYLTNYTK